MSKESQAKEADKVAVCSGYIDYQRPRQPNPLVLALACAEGVFPRPSIQHPKDRALSLRHLKELCVLVKRLCKVGLLRYPTDSHNTALGRCGRRIIWSQITQHEIVATIVKRVIPKQRSCSWVELVANGIPLVPSFFCSHSWAEPFRDFVATIEHHSKENAVGLSDGYWICVYANNQWNVEMGSQLRCSPFYEALAQASATVLLLDKEADALRRLWVIFEMHETTQTSKVLQIWTPLGRVGSGLVGSGPVVQALDRLDTATASASHPCDKRMIMNHIAGVEEMTGIRVTPEGGKELADTVTSPYEDKLVCDYRERFEALNMAVRKDATARISAKAMREHAGTNSSVIPDISLRGLTLGQLRSFATDVQAKLSGSSYTLEGRHVTWNLATWYDIDALFISPRRSERSCSFVELTSEKAQQPDFCVSWANQMLYKDFMQAIEWHAESRQLADTAVYFILPFAYYEQWTYGAVDRVIKDHVIGLVVVLDEMATCFARLAPAHEVHQALSNQKSVDLAATGGVLATTRPFVDGSWEFGDFSPTTALRILSFDVTKCGFARDEDRRWMLGYIATGVHNASVEPPKECSAYQRLNERLRTKVAGPVLREAGFEDEVDVIKEVFALTMALPFRNLRGALGETALHTAVAAGSHAVVRELLTLRHDANEQDLQGETPLHYAALAGQAESVRLLLEAGADPTCESFNGETPCQLAEQSLARFLGVDGRDVVNSLAATKAEVKLRPRVICCMS